MAAPLRCRPRYDLRPFSGLCDIARVSLKTIAHRHRHQPINRLSMFGFARRTSRVIPVFIGEVHRRHDAGAEHGGIAVFAARMRGTFPPRRGRLYAPFSSRMAADGLGIAVLHAVSAFQSASRKLVPTPSRCASPHGHLPPRRARASCSPNPAGYRYRFHMIEEIIDHSLVPALPDRHRADIPALLVVLVSPPPHVLYAIKFPRNAARRNSSSVICGEIEMIEGSAAGMRRTRAPFIAALPPSASRWSRVCGPGGFPLRALDPPILAAVECRESPRKNSAASLCGKCRLKILRQLLLQCLDRPITTAAASPGASLVLRCTSC